MKSSVIIKQYPRMIIVFFALIIAIGTALLALPISSKSGEPTPLIDALFTATSASCVTGLAVYDTYTHWSVFGQVVILVLIQVGGVGFMLVAAAFSLLLRRRIGLNERILLMEASGSLQLGGIVRMTKKIILGMLILESAGCALLAIRFCSRMGLKEGLFNAVFHSISAFCNAGFDLMGKYGAFSSLGAFSDDFLVCAVIAALIIVGSIGFLVWDDILASNMRWSKLSLHSKIVLSTTLVLILGGTVFLFFSESNGAMRDMSVPKGLASAVFHSISMRTAGFSFINAASLSGAGMLLTILLMIVGGSPCSAAGGIKTTTLFTMLAASRATLRNQKYVTAFKRQIGDGALRRACSISAIFLFMTLSGIILVSLLQSLPISQIVFEVVSASGTVGLSLGAMPHLSVLSRLVIIFLMYFGRAGILSLVFSFTKEPPPEQLKLPKEQIIIG